MLEYKMSAFFQSENQEEKCFGLIKLNKPFSSEGYLKTYVKMGTINK
jgi:hypothetical protein